MEASTAIRVVINTATKAATSTATMVSMVRTEVATKGDVVMAGDSVAATEAVGGEPGVAGDTKISWRGLWPLCACISGGVCLDVWKPVGYLVHDGDHVAEACIVL